MTNEKEMWRSRWFHSINELTSLDLQKRSWLDMTNTNPHWTFVEFIAVYFYEVLADLEYEDYIDQGWITPQEYSVIKEWHLALDKYEAPDNNNPYAMERILADNNWITIVDMGKMAKEQLMPLLNKTEREKLSEEINHKR